MYIYIYIYTHIHIYEFKKENSALRRRQHELQTTVGQQHVQARPPLSIVFV